MDFAFVGKYWPLFIQAISLTLKLAASGIVLAVLLGAFCAMVHFYRWRILLPTVRVYTELSRNTPLLIQLFFLYYALPKLGVQWEAFTCAVVGLAFLGGGYMAESLRAGLGAVRKTQIDTGLSIGLNRVQLMRHVIAPQAFVVALPAIGANMIFLLKEISVVSVIALADPVYVAKDLIGTYYKTDEALLMLVVAYLLMILPTSLLLTYWEKKVRYGRL